ncbi:MAG TPA: alanine-tRNA synthetase second additional domain-containing protein [Planctomycetota bacterium]|nr:alanine-tRNA synthetase second additional domain-containing protein [Planctomycetota bacterium]
MAKVGGGGFWRECLSCAFYYAPRGRPRLLMLGHNIAQRYLDPGDQLIGVMGEAGTGKSSLMRGMFPGLELTNDDRGVNVRPLPLLQMHRDGRFQAQTFHVDVRFEMAFAQLGEIAEAVRAAVKDGRRVVVEHFELLHPVLGLNAQFLLGVGEEVIVARPDLFGPFPQDIWREIEGTAVYRRMAHTAEDLTSLVLERDFGHRAPQYHSDVPRGFVIEFEARPEGLDLDALEDKVRELIARGVDISFADDDHIMIGDVRYPCTGPRIHLANASELRNFRLVKDLIRDEFTGLYCLVGLVGEPKARRFVERHAPEEPAGRE